MTIEYQLEESDFRKFEEERRLMLPQAWSKIYYWGILPAIGAALAVTTESLTIGVVFTALFFLSGWIIGHKSRQDYYAEIFSEQNLPAKLRQYKMTLKGEGVECQSHIGTALYPWKSVMKVIRTVEYIEFVFPTSHRTHIPVRAFSNEEEIKAFIRTARVHLNDQEDGGVE